AAERSAARGLKTLLLEKNRRPGVKILMSGGTRCNLTQATDSRGIVAAYGPSGKFLHSALAALSPQDLVALVEAEGVPTKVEDTGKIFPVSNRATDILQAFLNRLHRTPCELALDEPLLEFERLATTSENGAATVPSGRAPVSVPRFRLTTPNRALLADNLIITTGGQSYPGSGTTGDAYPWAAKLGHTIIPPRPALVPITTFAPWVRDLSGLTIPDVSLQLVEPFLATAKPKILDTRRGSLLFTHFGLSGPVVLDISRHVTAHAKPQSLILSCDFLPNEKRSALDQQLKSQAAATGKKQFLSLVPETIPRRLAELILQQINLSPDKKAAELSTAGRSALVGALKELPIPVAGTRGFAKAEVTAGGVALAEIDSRTMQSKLVPGLYFAGEVLDLDGPIGGYNFQAAFSTGWLAGMNV
ncbi:MAG TPA: NAD(P)/FAD-dependent oxidoreductase, partial [Pirellulales bacterium]